MTFFSLGTYTYLYRVLALSQNGSTKFSFQSYKSFSLFHMVYFPKGFKFFYYFVPYIQQNIICFKDLDFVSFDNQF